ncbi:DUF732 domain-containing protein [Rhodococcus sp. ABRD24]|uniref:DUF732 domain-containing protein n=1 Tax=Rhodococcus sp. ABRD24 TaxID=2507582 RepID=UPI00103BF875|nr:DUF732 domain-containing protein [Rhodococcus sp. ABRD24]QBJ94681.1 DUF732 domain-containing protein [Rhodococcus sp. ABRD24]
MIRSARVGILAALSVSALLLTGCSSTPTASDPVVTADAGRDLTTPNADTPAPTASTTTPPTAVPIRSAAPSVPVTRQEFVPVTIDALSREDIVFLSYITEFTLMEKSESDQIRLGRSICRSLERGISETELTAAALADTSYTRAEVANILNAATASYCPELG